MAIESKLIHFPKEQGFIYALDGATSSTDGLWGIVPDNAIAFIDDTHEIWTHGRFYGAKSYLSSLSNGFIQVYNGTVKSTPSLNLWGRYLGPADSSVNGEITIREGAYTAYDSNGQLILDKWGMPTTVQSPAKINLMVSGFAQSSTGNINNVGWHIKGPYYESTSNNNYSFSLTYTDASNSEKEYLILDQYGAMTLSGQGFNVIGKTTVSGGSTTYGLLTSDSGGNIIAQQAYLQGAYLNNTPIVFLTNKSSNYNWNAIQQYKNNTLQSISNNVAYITAKQHTSPETGWKPWITAASSSFDSWGIGLGGSSLWIGRVANSETENKLTNSWEFDSNGFITAKGFKVKGKDNNYVLLGDGSTMLLSNIAPANNVTGTGTSGYLTKWNGANTITNGPQLASKITSQTQSTKFLREDGTWAAPSYTPDVCAVSQNFTTLAIGTDWQTLPLDLTNLVNGVCIIMVNYRGIIYSGTFSYSATTKVSEEIVLHTCGATSQQNQGRLYLRTSSGTNDATVIQAALSVAESNITKFDLKIKQIIKL